MENYNENFEIDSLSLLAANRWVKSFDKSLSSDSFKKSLNYLNFKSKERKYNNFKTLIPQTVNHLLL